MGRTKSVCVSEVRCGLGVEWSKGGKLAIVID